MATRFSILIWQIPWMEEPGGLRSMGSQNRTQLSEHALVTEHNLLKTYYLLSGCGVLGIGDKRTKACLQGVYLL